MVDTPTAEFSRVYADFHDRVVAYAARLIGRDDAEDVAQEVFFRVARSLDDVEDPSKLASWIFAITLNVVRDLARSRASRVSLGVDEPWGAESEEASIDGLAHIPDTVTRTPEENASRNEMVACFMDYVKDLPDDYYRVYVLSEFGDLSNPEIARRLSLPLSTVKIRLHRARTRLHRVLRRDCECSYTDRGEMMGEPRRCPVTGS